jgi:prevent-host-death family protein
MTVTTKELRIQPGRILSQVNNGQEIIITYRGKNCARIVPLFDRSVIEKADEEIFGMWKDNKKTKDVDAFINNLRRGRTFDY